VVNASLRHELLAPEFKDVLAHKVTNECKDNTKSLRSLKESSPNQLAVFSNRIIEKEVEIHCPLLYTALCQASNMCSLNSEASKERAVNTIALLASASIVLQNWLICLHFLPKIVLSSLQIIQIDYKQLLDEVFVIWLRLITLTETSIILNITKSQCNNCFITHWTKKKLNSCFSFFSDGKQHKARKLDMITLRNHEPR